MWLLQRISINFHLRFSLHVPSYQRHVASNHVFFLFRLDADDSPIHKWLAKFEVAIRLTATTMSAVWKKCICICWYLNRLQQNPKSKMTCFCPKKDSDKATCSARKKKWKHILRVNVRCALIVNLYVFRIFVFHSSSPVHKCRPQMNKEADVVRTRCCCFLFF